MKKINLLKNYIILIIYVFYFYYCSDLYLNLCANRYGMVWYDIKNHYFVMFTSPTENTVFDSKLKHFTKY